MKTILLTESQCNHILKEMAYPSSFNMEVFKQIPSFRQRIIYCQTHLTRLSSGSSRIVYQIDDKKVLKLAKNSKGIAQNNTENDGYLQTFDCFAKTYDADENDLWIEMELAKKAKISDFKRLTGFDFKLFCNWVKYIASKYSRSYCDSKYKEFFESDAWLNFVYDDDNSSLPNGKNSEIFKEIDEYMSNYTLNKYGDLCRISSWGLVNRDNIETIVLIDYGLNDDVFDKYY